MDWDFLAIPDELNYFLLWSGMIYQLLADNASQAVISAITGYSSLYLINKIFFIIRKKQGIGHGDFKLFAAIAVWFGWFSLNQILLYASLMGLMWATMLYSINYFKPTKHFATQANDSTATNEFTLSLKKKPLDQPIAFGPWLLLGSYVHWLMALS